MAGVKQKATGKVFARTPSRPQNAAPSKAALQARQKQQAQIKKQKRLESQVEVTDVWNILTHKGTPTSPSPSPSPLHPHPQPHPHSHPHPPHQPPPPPPLQEHNDRMVYQNQQTARHQEGQRGVAQVDALVEGQLKGQLKGQMVHRVSTMARGPAQGAAQGAGNRASLAVASKGGNVNAAPVSKEEISTLPLSMPLSMTMLHVRARGWVTSAADKGRWAWPLSERRMCSSRNLIGPGGASGRDADGVPAQRLVRGAREAGGSGFQRGLDWASGAEEGMQQMTVLCQRLQKGLKHAHVTMGAHLALQIQDSNTQLRAHSRNVAKEIERRGAQLRVHSFNVAEKIEERSARLKVHSCDVVRCMEVGSRETSEHLHRLAREASSKVGQVAGEVARRRVREAALMQLGALQSSIQSRVNIAIQLAAVQGRNSIAASVGLLQLAALQGREGTAASLELLQKGVERTQSEMQKRALLLKEGAAEKLRELQRRQRQRGFGKQLGKHPGRSSSVEERIRLGGSGSMGEGQVLSPQPLDVIGCETKGRGKGKRRGKGRGGDGRGEGEGVSGMEGGEWVSGHPGLGENLLGLLLTKAVTAFLRSKIESYGDLKIHVDAKAQDLLFGRISGMSISVRRACFKGIFLSAVDLSASSIRLGHFFSGSSSNNTRHGLPVSVSIELTEQDLTSSLTSPLLAPVLRSMCGVEESEPLPPLHVALRDGFLDLSPTRLTRRPTGDALRNPKDFSTSFMPMGLISAPVQFGRLLRVQDSAAFLFTRLLFLLSPLHATLCSSLSISTPTLHGLSPSRLQDFYAGMSWSVASKGPLGALASISSTFPNGVLSASESLVSWGRMAVARECSDSCPRPREAEPLSLAFCLSNEGRDILVCSFLQGARSTPLPLMCSKMAPRRQQKGAKERAQGQEFLKVSCPTATIGGVREIRLEPGSMLKKLEVSPQGLVMQGSFLVHN